MSMKLNRREFMKGAAAGAAALAGSRVFEAPYILSAQTATDATRKLRTAVIGCGGQGTGAHVSPAAQENLVALIDADDKRIAAALAKAKGSVKGEFDPAKVKTYNDYRKFFDEMAKEVDAIFIATPNHHHALPALMAMERGIAVYVEKPMAYNIHEARLMAEFAKKYKVATQMGNQGHSGEGYRRLVEFIQAGAIGNVTKIYSWCDRTNGGVGPRPATMAPPANLNWDNWIGPAPYRDYHKDLHPHEWHGWHDFGGGSLGNMGCHVLDGAFWALNLDKPSAIEIEDVNGGSDERYPIGTRMRWDFPQRGDLPPVQLWWYDGKRKGAKTNETGGTTDSIVASAANVPPLLEELKKEYKEQFESNGTLYVGDKGIMYTGTYGGGVRLVPLAKQKEYKAPTPTIPRIKGSHQSDFLRGVRDPNYKPVANFEYSARLTEMMLMGCAALRLPNQGIGTKVEWDGDKSPNSKEFNDQIQRDYRKGWNY